VRHVRWPCERFYFALLDTSVLPPGERVTDIRLRFLFEPELPEPLDNVQAGFARVDERRWLACAAPKAALRDDLPKKTLTLSPSDLPQFVGEAIGTQVSPDRLNVLVGEFEPTPIRSLRRRSLLLGAIAGVVLFALVDLGIERRIGSARDDLDRLRAARDDIVLKALGTTPNSQQLPSELRLAAELRSLRQTRRQSESVHAAPDAADTLVDLLRRWPSDVPTRTETVVVTDTTVHAAGTVARSDDAQDLATKVHDLPGFEMGFPSVQSAPDGWRFGIELRRATETKR
jgi:hypothetical protein